ncbi:hypothetical protein GOP47_0001959 [Adiantum capillus-veneris]|uniref:Pentatricopeptide repeat-containing protein n=1 Tax=Adiantum capillus-veneris TaxID=13818 RepID=A0A9D4V993_ADICA|nr:hypothetical protein GOP47_0001959 [Adiantum capillus-veneris]
MQAQLLHHPSDLAVNGGLSNRLLTLEDGPPLQALTSALQKCNSQKEALHVHTLICNWGVEANSLLGTYLVVYFAAYDYIQYAQQIFDRLTFRTECSWTQLISGYHKREKPFEALLVYSKMQGTGGEGPCTWQQLGRRLWEEQHVVLARDLIMWTAIIGGYSQHGYGAEALKCFDEMQLDGQIDMAMELIRRMPCGPNLRLWDTLLAACRYWGDKKFGKIAFQQAVCLDGKDAMAYVLMAYICGDVDFGLAANNLEPL